MTTQEIADRLVELCRAWDYDTAYKELYSPDITSVWPKWSPEETMVKGLNALAEKGKKWNDMMEKFIDGWMSDPLVAWSYITLTMRFTCIYKWSTEETTENEICLYQVKDGKIISEQFFYDVETD
jgi:hypothetical protein